jgi:1,4-alpha-glucan branching enzyme
MKKIVFVWCLMLSTLQAFAQIVSVSPAFPTATDIVTITYNASEGNAALVGVSPIYAHVGLITSTSTSDTDWKYVQGIWGTADPNVLMTSLGNNLHQITLDMNTFFGFPTGTIVNKLAFVFRNAAGTVVGRDTDGSDIYYSVYQANSGLLAEILTPQSAQVVNLNDQISINAQSNQPSTLTLKDNGTVIASQTNVTVLNHLLTVTSGGEHLIEFTADNGTAVVTDSLYYVVSPTVTLLDPPVNTKNGLNVLSDTSVIIRLFAPEKNNVYVLGDFNNWTPTLAHYMHLSTDLKTWWIEIDGLTPDQLYGYQFLIDGNLVLADPLSVLVADPANDGAIPSETYPNPYAYPSAKTSGFISLFKTNWPVYNWQHDSYAKPAKTDLIIYELLVRDFIAKHNYQTLKDTLHYLAEMGVNAIELMPIEEYENNESWGYNPSFHMALDKYYGTPEQLKMFVDACHENNIAVILDIALNHAFGQNPMVNMYWDAANNRTAANNPWFNAICPHDPYCWGYDLNHEAQATKDYIDRVNHHWLDEFHIDGFRFDYSKGFVNSAASYSDTRIAILKRMADTIWSTNPDAYIILEHWADNNEEKILSNYGMMLWGNVCYEYRQAMKGSASNFSNGVHSARGWNDKHLVTYIESHDEERGMYDALTYGSTTNLDHYIKNNVPVALQRAQAAAVMLITTPGPKMIWQFGELGYDKSIDYGCRICNKPILWNYFNNSNRRQLYDLYKATTALKSGYETFKTGTFQYSLSGVVKRLSFQHATMDAVVLANFAVVNTNTIVSFSQMGTWYEYYTGDSIVVTQTSNSMLLKPAEYRVYTNVKLPKPSIISTASISDLLSESFEFTIYPNPTTTQLNVSLDLKNTSFVNLKCLDLNGKVVLEKSISETPSGKFETELNVTDLKAGDYLLLIETKNGYSNQMFIKK